MHRRHFIAGLLLASSPLAITHTAAQPAPPPGTMTAGAYLQMAQRGGMLLEDTARDAFDKTQDPRLKKFSRAEVVEQVSLADKLGAATGGAGMATTPATPGGVVGGIVATPFVAAGAVVGAAGSVLGLPGGPSEDQKAEMVTRLKSTAPGPAYDALFVQVQLMGHQEAFAIHDGYARNGDDPALRRIARGALPLIRLHIAQLTRFQAG